MATKLAATGQDVLYNVVQNSCDVASLDSLWYQTTQHTST